jgi:hypothetical protein
VNEDQGSAVPAQVLAAAVPDAGAWIVARIAIVAAVPRA